MGTIRFLLAIAIVCFHTTPLYKNYLSFGEVALETFFVVSGFSIARVLHERYTRKRDFYLSRILRIYPPYVILLGLTIIACVAHGQTEIAPGRDWPIAAYDTWRAQWSNLSLSAIVALSLANLLLVGQDVMMFLAIDGENLAWTSNFAATPLPAWKFLFNPPAWSLSLELMFYLFAPFIVRRPLALLIALTVATLGLKLVLANGYGLAHDPWSYRFFPTELPLFILGICGYRFFAKYQDSISRPAIRRGVGTILFCVWVAWTILYDEVPFNHHGTAFLAYSVIAIPFVAALTAKSRMDTFFGELSYPIYVVHYPIMLVVIQWWDNSGLFVAPLAVAFSIAYQLLIGRSIERYRHRVTNARLVDPTSPAFAHD